MTKKLIALLLALAMVFALAACGQKEEPAQEAGQEAAVEETVETWEPAGVITMIAGAAAGSGYDTSARQFCKLFNETGIVTATMKVENEAGGAGQVSYENFKNTKKGSEEYLTVGSTATIGGMITNGWECTLDDLTPVAKLVVDPWVIVAKTGDSRYETIDAVIDALKADPTSIKIGSALPPDPDYIGLVLLCQKIGVDPNALNLVIYDGGGESVPALLGGSVDLCISTTSEFASFVEAGQVKALATATAEPLTGAYEGVPTFKSMGVDLEYGNWRGFFAPADIPEAELTYWRECCKQLVETPEFAEACQNMQWINEPVIDNFTEWVHQFYDDMTNALKETGII